MRYHLPPAPVTPGAHGVEPVAPLAGPADPHPYEPEPHDPSAGRIVRTVAMPAAEAGPYLVRWGDGHPPAHEIAAGARTALERTRPDRTLPGGTRRQRLAVVVHGAGATAVHWSAPEPVLPDDERAWRRALARAAGDGDADPGGWTA
jgi:hypothetical protein